MATFLSFIFAPSLVCYFCHLSLFLRALKRIELREIIYRGVILLITFLIDISVLHVLGILLEV